MGFANKFISLLCVFCAILSLNASAQNDSLAFKQGKNYRFYLEGGDVLTGFVVDETFNFITIERRPQLTRTDIRKSSVLRTEEVSLRESLEEDVMGENSHADLYMLSGSVLPFKPQTVSSSAHWFVFDDLQYTFSENWALHCSSITFYPFGLGLKCSFKLDELNYIGGNITGFAQLGSNDLSSDLLGYLAQAKITHGTSNRNFTIGAGFIGVNPELIGGFATDKLLVSTPLLTAGFCNRFASRWAVVLDGHVLPDEGVMLGGMGVKFLRDDYICWTFGAYSFVNDFSSLSFFGMRSFSFPLPYFSYARKFD